MSREQTLTHAQVAEIGRVRALLPGEAQFKGRKGYKKRYCFNADGTPRRSIYDGHHVHEWRYDYKTNEKGKLTREASEVLEMMRPFSKADVARHLNNQGKKPLVRLRNRAGGIDYLPPEIAETASGRKGRTHIWTVRGGEFRGVCWGPDGMGFVRMRGEWRPTGKLGVGVFARKAPRSSAQRDPDGGLWLWIDRAWRLVD